jgi:hypothetical protein
MQDRPTAAELVEAVREFIERDAMPALTGRTAFHARVACNVLAIVQRELEQGPAFEAAEHARLRELLGHDGSIRELNQALAVGLCEAKLDDRQDDVLRHLKATVAGKLAIDNPKYARG